MRGRGWMQGKYLGADSAIWKCRAEFCSSGRHMPHPMHCLCPSHKCGRVTSRLPCSGRSLHPTTPPNTMAADTRRSTSHPRMSRLPCSDQYPMTGHDPIPFTGRCHPLAAARAGPMHHALASAQSNCHAPCAEATTMRHVGRAPGPHPQYYQDAETKLSFAASAIHAPSPT